MSETLHLNCCFLDSEKNEVFLIDIESTKSVYSLQKTIKDKKSNEQGVNPNTLVLWKVPSSVPVSPDMKEDLKNIKLIDKQPLRPMEVLSEVFPGEAPAEGHLHIVIQVPTVISPAALYSVPRTFTLNCVAFGDSPNEIFQVDIAETNSVSELKDMIKDKKWCASDHVVACSLVLRKLSLPISYGGGFQEILRNIKLIDEDLLWPTQVLSEVFPGVAPTREYLHIVVKLPPLEYPVVQPSPSISQEGTKEEDNITALKKNFNKTLVKIMTETPSDSSKSSGYRHYQKAENPIYDGQYDVETHQDTAAPPIELFHPVFGHFFDDLANDKLVVTQKVTSATVKYMQLASGIYGGEEARGLALGPALRDAIGMDLFKLTNSDETLPDGVISQLLHGDINESVALLIKEDKKDFGGGGSDPATRVGLSMSGYWAQTEHEIIRDNTCCPTFLLANAGPWFAILGAVLTDKVIVQRLTDYIWVGMQPSLNEAHCNRVAHIMQALNINLKRLCDYYETVKVITVGSSEIHPRYCPSINAYRDPDGEKGVLKFKYIMPLETDPTCVTFLARTLEKPLQSVVVKFVQRYGVDAHRLLASNKLAPKLLYFGKVGVQDGDPSYRNLFMVVMEYIDGTTLNKAGIARSAWKSWHNQIERALELLHDNGFVFGDLRPPNIMVTKNGDIKLIDFDWAGKDGESRYPLLMSNDIKWVKGMKPSFFMYKEHDLGMFARLMPD